MLVRQNDHDYLLMINILKPFQNHCFNHRLKLITKACEAMEIEIALQKMNAIRTFINASTIRGLRFTEAVQAIRRGFRGGLRGL